MQKVLFLCRKARNRAVRYKFITSEKNSLIKEKFPIFLQGIKKRALEDLRKEDFCK